MPTNPPAIGYARWTQSVIDADRSRSRWGCGRKVQTQQLPLRTALTQHGTCKCACWRLLVMWPLRGRPLVRHDGWFCWRDPALRKPPLEELECRNQRPQGSLPKEQGVKGGSSLGTRWRSIIWVSFLTALSKLSTPPSSRQDPGPPPLFLRHSVSDPSTISSGPLDL